MSEALTFSPLTSPTLVDVLRERAESFPHQRAYSFLADGEEESASLTYGELDRRARVIAAELQRTCAPGDRALLLYPPSLEFIAALFGCFYAGVIAVPLYPPRVKRADPRLASVIRDALPALALTEAAILSRLAPSIPHDPALSALTWVATEDLPEDLAESWREPLLRGDQTAFLQYTSGSTANPKGVMVSHEGLVYNEEMIRCAFGLSEKSVVLSWLPLYHDMGLIGGALQPLYLGAPGILMPPAAFLQQPMRWLRAISRYRATGSGGPNFAFDLCARRAKPEDCEGLDLSCWQVAFNGAEPVRADTLDRFAEVFAPYGFRREAFSPCYGLAEATLLVTGIDPGSGPQAPGFDAASLEQGIARPPQDERPARRLVGCGHSWLDQKVVIVDPQTRVACAPGAVGEIWVAGPSVALGYWEQPELSEREMRATLEDGGGPFLRTGDLGFFQGDELFVTGRIKDLLIIRGRNLYPQDVELTSERSHPALRAGGNAAFTVELDAEPRLVVVQEVDRHYRGDLEPLAQGIRRAVAEEHEVQVHEVVLARMGSVPKTSSGKVQRNASRAAWLAGELDVLGRSALEAGPAGEAAAATAPDRAALSVLPEEDRLPVLESWLRAEAGRALGVAAGRVDPESPLTALGLDSLAAMDLRTRVEGVLGISLPLARLLEGVTLAEIAAEALDAVAAGAAEPPGPAGPVPRGEETGVFPLSYGQKALWFLHRLAPESLAYHLAGAARVRGALDVEALARALTALVARHPALRTTFTDSTQGPVQRVHGELAPEFVVLDLASGEDPEERLRAEMWRPFDPERGPLVRLGVARSPEGEPLLFLAVHHLVVDFWSLAVIARDLGALYAQESGRPAEDLAPLVLTSTDVVRWQESRLAGPEGERLWEYWRETLAPGGQLAPRLELPTDRPLPPAQTWNGDARGFRLGAAVAEELQALARPRGATVFMALFSVFEALLARYTGARDLLVGSPTAGRSASELAGLVGYFVNPVPVRVRLGAEPSFTDVLDATRAAVVGAFEHQDFPFPLLAERLQPERISSRPPLFDVAFTFEKARGAGADLGGFALGEAGARLPLGGIELESLSLVPAGTPFNLMLTMAEAEGGLGASLRFNTDLFDAATVERMAGHFETLLAAALAEPGRRIWELPLLTGLESRQLLVDWNRTEALWPEDVLLHEPFEEAARRTPEAVALVAGPERLSYDELNGRADRLARRLRALGVGPETRVGVFLERTPRLVISILAVLKAGGAYVPLDPAYPRERLETILEDAEAPVLITEGALLPALPVGLEGRIVRADEEEPAPAASFDPPVRAGRLAYVIYTSGSTGRPKGVAIEHRSAAALVHWARETFRPEELSRTLASTSICFDLSVFELFAPLSCGGAVVLAENALELPGLPAAGEVTLINTVPSAMAELVRQGAVPASVRTVNLAGEPLRGALARRILDLGTVERLLNLYGPSEDTTYSTIAVVGGEGEPTIGRPVANTRAYVLDPWLQPVRLGAPGELYLAGAGLSRGYLGRPDLTAERYVPDPFAAVPGERLYRTGDLVRFRPDGEMEFLGRLDHQVKVRGFRIELGEVEAALAAHPALRDAVVLALGEGAERRLVAYVVPREGAEAPDLGRLRSALQARLPEYMLPSALVALDALPLTPNGKVDRKALARIEPAAQPVEAVAAPRTPVEELLCEIWAGVLGLERVGVSDSFFEIGGHSLLATQVISRMRQSLGVEVPVRQLFETPTVEGLARAVEALRRAGAGEELPPLVKVDRQGPLPLSFSQERLWFLDQLAPESPLYNIPAGLRLEGRLSVPAFERSLREVVRRHEALRTVFGVEAGRPVQVVREEGFGPVPVVDLGALASPARSAELRRLARHEGLKPFDLTRGPLLRVTLVRLAAEEHAALVTMHHIVSDGWSLGVFVRELSALYVALASGEEVRLPEMEIQYADFAQWQRSWLKGEVLEGELGYWRERLAGAPPLLELPTDRPRPSLQSSRGALRPLVLGREVVDGLRGLVRREGASLFMGLLAGLDAVLLRTTGQTDLVVGTPIANRTRAELEGLIGFFVNTLALRIDAGGDPAFRELLSQVREVSLGAYAHQDLPFEKLVEAVQPERSLSYSPVFQVVLALQNAPMPGLELPDLSVELMEAEAVTAKFDLSVVLTEVDGELRGELIYGSDLFDDATVARLGTHLEVLLSRAVLEPEARISELPLMPEPERHQVLVEWNENGRTGGGQVLLHQVFEQWARRTPEAPAVMSPAESLSYRELNARANRIARKLRGLGVEPEVRVGVFLERSFGWLATFLGVLKSGGVYVPMDPAYPADRLSFMLDDAGLSVVVVDASTESLLPPAGAPVLRLEEVGPEIPADDLEGGPWPEHLAYIVYTSGSTGRPKGVGIEHSSLSQLWATHRYVLGLTPRDRVLQFFSLSFDASISETTLALSAGAALCQAPADRMVPGDPMARVLREFGITALIVTPSALAVLPAEDLPLLQTIVVGGEACTPDLGAKWGPGRRFYNGYGPAEVTVVSIQGRHPGGHTTVKIGRALPHAQAYLLDRSLEPVPLGASGEIYLGGDALARGYLGRPELTAERFQPNRFGPPGSRMYRTGDLARWVPDGNLDFLGRVDHQVKVRGFRIELEEVESALASHAGVRDCMVVLRTDLPGGRALVAFFEPETGQEPAVSELREFLRERLPDYMVPALFVQLPSLPLTPAGKVDRRKLETQEISRVGLEERYVAPRTPVEELLSEVWAGVLGLERVGVRESFFEIGGHSLLATQVISRVRQSLGVELAVRQLFETPTIEGLAQAAETAMRADAGVEIPPLVKMAREGSLPLSFAQERLWFLDQLAPDSPLYNIPAGLRLRGRLSVPAFGRSLAEVVRRHEALRTVFGVEEGRPVQVVLAEGLGPVPVVDLGALPPLEKRAELRRLARNEGLKPFDLARGPLLRAMLVRLEAEEHAALVTMHHIVSDGWSVGVFVRELSALYVALVSGEAVRLPELEIQYADFARWQRSWLKGEVLEGELGYWQERLAGAPPLLELPTDRPRPSLQSFRGASRPLTLSRGAVDGLKGLVRREGASLFMGLLAGLDAVLLHHTAQTDLVVGTPIANRTRAELEGLIGFFVNTLALRVDAGGDPDFRELLSRVREVSFGAYAHQSLPFEKLVEAVQPERSLSYTPLFQVVLALQNAPAPPLELPDLSVEVMAGETSTAQFDLSVVLTEVEGELQGVLIYGSDLFDESTVARFGAHLEVLLSRAALEPETRISELPLMPEPEQHQILVEWNENGRTGGGQVLLHEVFEQWARRTPEAPAVMSPAGSLSYRELNTRANRIARRLRDMGVRPEVRVGVFLERSFGWLATFLGVLKSGGVYVPMDPSYPADRLSFMLEDAGLSVVVVDASTERLLPPAGAPVLRLEEVGPEIPAEDLEDGPWPEHLAYVVYTSGSTGRPKGVGIEHSSLSQLWATHRYVLGLTPQDRVLQFFSLSFDASISETTLALSAGAALCQAPAERMVPGDPMARVLREFGITALIVTPSALAVLPAEDLPLLQTIVVGGEACTPDLGAKWGPGRRFYNGYGPAEVTVVSIQGRHPGGHTTVKIGRALPHTRAYLLDRSLEPVPLGASGEIYLGGDGLARGYLGRPELTAERFLPNRFGPPGSRLYRTGDLARWVADGNLDFLGRVDHQVKVRGFRIELGEVESALASHAGVRDCMVVLRTDLPGGRALVAFFEPEDGGEPSVSELREFLRERLPDYMVPALFVQLPALPLTPAGKVDRRKLETLEISRVGLEERYVAPRTPVEELLAEVWAGVLGLERVGVSESFFEIGGHSLLATQVISRVREAVGVELSVRQIFETPTIEGLAQAAEVAMRASTGVEIPPLVKMARQGSLPLSFAQERLWFLDQLAPDSPLYNIPAGLLLRGRLSVPVFERSLAEVVRRHEALRTVFEVENGRPVQVVLAEGLRPVPVVDLGTLPPGERDAELRRLARIEGLKPFDLSRGPLLRVTLVRLAAEEHAALVTMHHIVSDGWSVGVFVRELSAFYLSLETGEEARLPEMEIQYADFARWQRSWLTGKVLEGELGYWRERLAGAPPLLELPADRPRPSLQSSRGAIRPLVLGRDVVDGLKKLVRREGASLFMGLLAGLDAVLLRTTGQTDLVVGSPIANRTRAELEGLIGFFVNTLALRIDAGGDPAFGELLTQVREVSLGAYAHQDLPFEKLVEAVQPERSLSYSPVFQVVLALQNAPAPPLELPGLSVEVMEAEAVTAKFDLSLIFAEVEGELPAVLIYGSDLFDPSTVARFGTHLEALLSRAVLEPETRISQLPLMPEAERHQVLTEWNDSARTGGGQILLHQIFEQWARRTPEAPAVMSPTESLSYRELNARANRIARKLRSLGVEPEVRVGVFLERSFGWLTTFLGVLKAGGVYVPMDPSYPADRLSFMLEDSELSVVVVDASTESLLPPTGAPLLRLEEVGPEIPGEDLEDGPWPQHLAYIVYTSGSTGRPKGVGIEHSSLSRLWATHRSVLGLTPEDRVLQFFSLSFDASISETTLALSAGAALCQAPAERMVPGDPMARVLREFGITALIVTPSALAVLPAEDLPLLQTIVVGGEACTPDLGAKWGPGRRFYNGYGPAEVTVVSIQGRHPGGHTTVKIGRALPHAQAYLLDRFLEPVPLGSSGEIYLGGNALARGYLGRPELTAERFLPNRFGPAGSRMYRTGDLARWVADGNLDFLGRVDHQVKVRGFRIELGEVESALASHAGVRDCMVVLRTDLPGGRALVAFFEPETGQEPSVSELRGFLRERLPDYMVPALFVQLAALPLTPAGKVDRRLLETQEISRVGLENRYVAPRTPVEELLAEVWAGVLGLERVGVSESFFEIGGHSLLATQVISRVREALGVELAVRQLFETPTIEGLAQAAEVAIRAGSGVELPPLVKMAREGSLPLSFAQERLWFLDQLAPDSPLYNIPAGLRLRGRLSVPAFGRSLAEVVRRHEALRTVFEVEGGRPVQSIREEGFGPVPVVDLGALAPRERDAELRRLTRDEGLKPFDLARGPLLRVTLVRLEDEEHAALVTMHHIVSDGWSVGVFVRELSAFYKAEVSGEEARLPEMALQYADFAQWQRSWLKGEVLESELGYWRERLVGAPPLLELPADRPRPSLQSSRGAIRSLVFGRELVDGLRNLVRREGASLFMGLLAGLDAVLLRTTGQTDLVVGSPIANRTRGELEGLIGFFVNTLALRVDAGGDPAFGELLSRVREVSLGAYAHQSLPFEKLVEAVQPERSLSYSPVFQVALALQNAPAPPLELPGLSIEVMEAEAVTAKFDLSLVLAEVDGELQAALIYGSDLFDDSTMARFGTHLEVLLSRAVLEPEARISELPLMPEPERHQVLVEWNENGRTGGGQVLLHEIFEQWARRTPEAPAVMSPAESLSYRELNARANRIARKLRGLGVEPEVRVGVFLERSFGWLATFLGVLKSGGVYVPMDPAYPADRLSFMLDDAGLSVVVVDASTERLLPPAKAPVLRLEEVDPEISGEDLEEGPWPEHLAYIVYTSGSTGRPKGVGIEHSSLSQLWATHRYVLGLTPKDRVLQFFSLSFDASISETTLALSAGAALCQAPPERMVPGDPMARVLREFGITALIVTPSALAVLPAEDLPLLQTIVVGGEACTPDLGAKWGPGRRFYNGYGPAEVTVVSIQGRHPGGHTTVKIGRALPHTRAYLLDRSLEPVPLGASGEIYLGGDGLARGYLGRPELTAERFLPNRFGPSGSRMYRTGDLARWVPDGNLDFLGRVDHQVKVRGFRIELGEVESALASHAGVRDCMVVLRTDLPGGRALVAFFEPETGQEPAVSDLRGFLRERLPDYMVPALFVQLPALPLTPAGKVDRRRLETQEISRVGLEDRYVAPRTPVEELMAEVWAGVLGLERVGVRESFFEIGGHSLLATQVISRVRETLGVELNVRQLFETPTIEGLAQSAEALMRAGTGADLPPLVRTPRDRPLLLSFPQLRFWNYRQHEAGSAVSNTPMLVRLVGSLDVTALLRSLQEIVDRHEALRTNFTELDGQPVQRIHQDVDAGVRFVDLSGLPSSDRTSEASRLASQEVQHVFDLERNLLFRMTLVRFAPEDHALWVVAHHIIMDGWSSGVFVRELGALYGAFSQGRPSPLPEPPIQYADYAAWQHQYLQGEVRERLLSYWRERLDDGEFPVVQLPTDRPRPAVRNYRAASESLSFDAELVEELQRLAQSKNTSLFITLLALYKVLLSRWTGQEDIALSTNVANRNRVETEGALGLFTNVLPLRTDLSGDPTFSEVLERVRETTLEAYAHQELPFVDLLPALSSVGSKGHNDLFPAGFVLQNFPFQLASLPGLQVLPFNANAPQELRRDMMLIVARAPQGNGMVSQLTYRTDIFESATMRQLLTRLENLIRRAVKEPDARISTLDEQEVEQLNQARFPQ